MKNISLTLCKMVLQTSLAMRYSNIKHFCFAYRKGSMSSALEDAKYFREFFEILSKALNEALYVKLDMHRYH